MFDVSLEGTLVLDNLDIYSLLGHDVAIVRTFTVTVTDGVLDIEFTKILDSPKISAIEVISNGSLAKKGNSILDSGDLIQLPETFELTQNYPNPFNPETSINLALPHSGSVKAVIFNIQGNVVKQIYAGQMQAGFNILTWNGRDSNDIAVGSGIYFLRVLYSDQNTRKEEIRTRRMLLLK